MTLCHLFTMEGGVSGIVPSLYEYLPPQEIVSSKSVGILLILSANELPESSNMPDIQELFCKNIY